MIFMCNNPLLFLDEKLIFKNYQKKSKLQKKPKHLRMIVKKTQNKIRKTQAQ